MKKSKLYRFMVLLIILVMTATACAKGAKYSSSLNDMADNSLSKATADSQSSEPEYSADQSTGTSATAEDGSLSMTMNQTSVQNTSSLNSSDLQAQSQDKIIKSFNLEVETQDFDSLIKSINDKIKALGGYVESSSINGNSYLDRNVNRTGDVVARIPSAKADEFVGAVGKEANVTNNECSTENVTLQYIDAQSRVQALKIEQDRLFAILEKTDKLESIITLESRLGEIRYELQNYESQLRAYDNKVEYSTVTLSIQEVERITKVVHKKPSFTNRITTGFSDTIYHISEGTKNFIVWLIVNLPYLLLWVLLIFIIVVIVRRFLKKVDKKDSSDPYYQNSRENPSQNSTNLQNNDDYKDQDSNNIK